MGQPCNPIFESNRECASKKRQLKEILKYYYLILLYILFWLLFSQVPHFLSRSRIQAFFYPGHEDYISLSCHVLNWSDFTILWNVNKLRQNSQNIVLSGSTTLVAPFHVRPKPNMKVTNTCVTFECLLIVRFFLLVSKLTNDYGVTPCEFIF